MTGHNLSSAMTNQWALHTLGAYSQWLHFLKSTAGIIMCDKRLVSLPSMKYEGHVTTPTRPTVSTADETRNQPSLLRRDKRL